MSEFRTLLENFWICKEADKETYYKVKRDIPNFQRFVREQLGWKLVHTENLLKLEKRPAHAKAFMGIGEFTEIRDYCILCAVLMYLEDKEEQEQFLLSELIDYVETQLKAYMAIDWTSFTQRKSLVRVLQFMERLKMLKVYEGRSEAFGAENGQEVLYENTGYSKYFATSFSADISGFNSWEDFEKPDFEEFQENRGAHRINRVYRQLTVCPSMFWESSEDADSLYLKNQRQWVAKYIHEHMGGNLDLYKNLACISMDGEDCFGPVHPRDAMLPEIVLLVCGKIRKEVSDGTLEKQENECIYTTKERMADMILSCRREWRGGWSKEYREMEEERLVENVLEYMAGWLMIRCDGERMVIFPSAGRTAGVYPKDFKGGDVE